MTEARHDHAVSLLTAASTTISLLLERETGGAYPPSPPPHSSSTPTATVAATMTTAIPGEPLLPRLSPSLLATALEGPYPVEVRHLPIACSMSTASRWRAKALPGSSGHKWNGYSRQKVVHGHSFLNFRVFFFLHCILLEPLLSTMKWYFKSGIFDCLLVYCIG